VNPPRKSGCLSIWNDLLWWKKDEPQGTTFDAPAETARLKEAKDKGESLNRAGTAAGDGTGPNYCRIQER